jgi:polyphosphate kinase 2 (PPK2 family)
VPAVRGPRRGRQGRRHQAHYHRACVERVTGFCTDEEYWKFLRACPLFEEMLEEDTLVHRRRWQ